MTKFQKAKKQTIGKMDRVLWMLTREFPDLSSALTTFELWENCGFCAIYHNEETGNCCKDCPIYKKANRVCYRQKGYKAIRNSFLSDNPNKAIPHVLAFKMYIEEMEE